MPSSTRRFIIVDDSTIREARDRQEESRPRKRQRVDEDEEEKEGEEEVGVAGTRLVCDADYYKDEGDCVLWVENTLFKVHREVLLSSHTFADILEGHRGATDGHPLQLHDISVRELRALLFALYARPEDGKLVSLPLDHTGAELVILLATISHKYAFQEIHKWATDILEGTASSNPVFMESCSSATLSLMVDVAVQCSIPHLLSSVVDKWRERVLHKSTPSVPAIQAADKHELPSLRGVAYYVHVQDMLDRQSHTPEGGGTQLRVDPKLNNGQVMRLLSGYCSLVSYWERLRLKPLELPRASEACTVEAHRTCTATWERRWVSAVGWKRILGYNSADVLALLTCLRDQLGGDDELKRGTTPECRAAGLDLLKTKMETTREHLADHFFGCI